MLDGSSADYPTIESGVPRGSFLGPLLILIYINDLEKNIKSNVISFENSLTLLRQFLSHSFAAFQNYKKDHQHIKSG